MQTRSRYTLFVALWLFAALPATAQEVPDNGTIGAPELRGFRLPGTRVVPPPTTQSDPAPASPPPDTQRAPAPEVATPQPAPARRERPAARVEQAAPAASAASRPPTDAPRDTAPREATPLPAEADAYPVEDIAPLAVPAPAMSEPSVPASAEAASSGMMWPALAAGLALLGGLFFYRRRCRLALAGDAEILERAPLPEPAPEPAPGPAGLVSIRRPVPVQLKEEDETLKPVLELEFRPERMVATDAQAAVHFELFVRNAGGGPARNVRVEAMMFNASAQQNQEIAAFLATPTQMDSAAASLSLQPGQAVQMRSNVVMPKQNVREIHIDGRPLFIPTVAVRIVYQWGRARSDQTHKTYLVGIENQKSPQKMGPFRLDLGPRIYRSVGGRQIELARAG